MVNNKLVPVIFFTYLTTCLGLGIGGGILGYSQAPQRGRISRSPPPPSISSLKGSGIRYFRDPSPSHLRYPTVGFKTRNEGYHIKSEPTRWDWINSMSQEYYDDPRDNFNNEIMEKVPEKPEAQLSQKETDGQKILRFLMERIQQLSTQKTNKSRLPTKFSRTSASYHSDLGPRPPLLVMG